MFVVCPPPLGPVELLLQAASTPMPTATATARRASYITPPGSSKRPTRYSYTGVPRTDRDELKRATALVVLALQRIGGESRRDDRIASRKPRPRKEEQPAKEERDSQLRHTDGRTAAVINRRDHLEIAFEPDAHEAHNREAHHRGRELLRLLAEQADEGDQKHEQEDQDADRAPGARDRKSTRLNSSHRCISYAVFCLKKKKENT